MVKPKKGLVVRKELDKALARANKQAKAERRDAAREEAEADHLRDEEYRDLFEPAKALAGELVRRAQTLNLPMNRVIRFSVFRKRRWKSGWIWQERSYWLVSLRGSSSTTITRNLLIDADANLYWEDGYGQQPLPIVQELPHSREYVPNFTVELVAEWIVAATRKDTD